MSAGSTSSQSHAKMNTVLIRNNLQVAQRMRMLEASTYQTFILPETSKIVEGLMSTGKRYADAVSAAGPKHGLGPPHLYNWCFFIEYLAKSETQEKDMKQHWAALGCIV